MQIGITSVQRDRAPWIKEWIAFHHLVGFNKFYIFVHNSHDGTKEILDGLRKKFDIQIIIVDKDTTQLQFECNQYSCDNFLQEVDWMAFIDGDEFLFPTSKKTIGLALNDFSNPKISAIGVYWACFGGSGYIREPSGLIIENYKYRANKSYINNRHIKSIVKGKGSGEVAVGNNAHLFKTPFGTYDENMRKTTSGFANYHPTYNKFRINHYLCQSKSYFLKTRKNSIWVNGGRTSESWWTEHNKNEVLDRSMDKYVIPLKKLLTTL